METKDLSKTDLLYETGMGNILQAIICYKPSSITTNGMWQNEKPLDFSLPLFILQLMIVVITTQIVVIILKPLRQPKIVSEIIAGILFSPSFFGSIEWIGIHIFPLKSIMVLETMGNIGILYYMFLVGVEMDASLVKQTSPQTLAMVVFSLFVPLALFVGIQMMVFPPMNLLEPVEWINTIYTGVAVTFTSFPCVSRILVELKLFNSEIGRKAMSTALVLELCGWFLVTICVVWLERNNDEEYKIYVPIIGGIGFLLLCIILIRPAIIWVSKRSSEGETFNEFYICLILTGVMICGSITDAIGIHSVFGAFIFGLVIPNGLLGKTLLEKLEDFVNSLLLPIFFVRVGLNVNLNLSGVEPKYLKVYFIQAGSTILTYATKMLSTFLINLYYDMQMYEALSLAMLVNTNGVIEIIVLNLATFRMISPFVFSITLACMVLVTAVATPATIALYNTSRRFIVYKCMTIQKIGMNAQLKMLMCFYNPRNVNAMVNLLKASHATKSSPIHVHALHLVELTGRASAMLIVHNVTNSGMRGDTTTRAQTQSEHIVKALDNYAKNSKNVLFAPITVVSPYATMHEDVCNLVKDKRINIIIVPFHKQQTVDGGMETTNPTLRQVSQNILANASCSVGILIDKGLGGGANQTFSHIAVIFIGGSDDREALAYGWRMVEDPNVTLTVMRFISKQNATEQTMKQTTTHDHNETDTVIANMESEAQLDDEYLGDFRLKTLGQKAIMFKENVVSSAEEVVTAIRAIETIYDLCIVGRGQGIDPALTAGLNDFIENPELGAIGDLLASSDFATINTVLVMQQCVGD